MASVNASMGKAAPSKGNSAKRNPEAARQQILAAALELAYSDFREAEKALKLDDLSPVEGMRKLVALTLDYFNQTPYFITLLNRKNLHSARYLHRQGLLQGTWCLNLDKAKRPGQAEELDRVFADDLHLCDDGFVAVNLERWLA